MKVFHNSRSPMFKIVFRRRVIRRPRRGTRVNYLKYKEAARELVKRRLEYYNRLYQFKIGRVSIKNHKSRWGSCSKKGNLNFNYKLALLPPEMADYVIVHELCHLGEFNHSKNFWKLVAMSIPDYLEIKNKFKKIHV